VDVRKHLRVYLLYFKQFWKSRLIYKADFVLGFVGQLINLTVSLAFLGLLFTQVDTIHGWTFTELLFLAGFGGIVMNIHHIFFLNIYSLGERYIVQGRLDRFLVRPLNPLFQVYADSVADDNVSKLLANIGIVIYAASRLGIPLVTAPKMIYGTMTVISGVMVFAAVYLTFASTAFWTGKSKAAIWILFRLSDFRRYPFGIYMLPVQVLLATLVPIAFATFFPATYFLERGAWGTWQMVSVVAGPVFFLLAYQAWRLGLSNYSSTGS